MPSIFFFFFILSIHAEDYSTNVSRALNLISTFVLISLSQYLCRWTIIHPLLRDWALTWLLLKCVVLVSLHCSQRLLNYLAFKYVDLECTWWRLFQKHGVRTKLDIYVFILSNVFIINSHYGSPPSGIYATFADFGNK